MESGSAWDWGAAWSPSVLAQSSCGFWSGRRNEQCIQVGGIEYALAPALQLGFVVAIEPRLD